MHKSAFLSVILLILIVACTPQENQPKNSEVPAYSIVIHGGAGTILKKNMSDEMDSTYRAALTEALGIGEEILKSNGNAIDAVIQTISFMENSPLFNAGKGAVLTHNEENELDASIMTGWDQNAGAVGGVKRIKNPITGAQAVLEKSDHVLLVGEGADRFGEEHGLQMVEPEYFKTPRRLESLRKVKARAAELGSLIENEDYKYGTVGCVALDSKGNIVAGTSTGGMTNKKYNRIGDSPIIGAGTYADNATCGVSSTGHGEFFIRYAVAYDIAARMRYGNETLASAAETCIMQDLKEKGGSGGIVALDNKGNISMPFNTEGMYRGYAKPGIKKVMIYGDER